MERPTAIYEAEAVMGCRQSITSILAAVGFEQSSIDEYQEFLFAERDEYVRTSQPILDCAKACSQAVVRSYDIATSESGRYEYEETIIMALVFGRTSNKNDGPMPLSRAVDSYADHFPGADALYAEMKQAFYAGVNKVDLRHKNNSRIRKAVKENIVRYGITF